jgi:ABC-type sugar transport system ATPase subunit
METLIEFDGISKAFPGVQALKNVAFSIEKDSIHALVGENGAGKSTFINICGGIVQKDQGEIAWEGEGVTIDNPRDSRRLGISVVHQHFPQCGNLSVAQNIYMPLLAETSLSWLNWRSRNVEAKKLIDRFGFELDPAAQLGDLPVAQRQLVEICKAVAQNAQLIIMDEPTSALNLHELESFMGMMEWLRSNHFTILYVSHKLDEVFQIADKITVLKDGEKITTLAKSETSPREIASFMVGHRLDTEEKARVSVRTPKTTPVIEIRGLSTRSGLKNINVSVWPGEILGLAGLAGSGCSTLMKVIFGMERRQEGEILLNGRPTDFRDVRTAIQFGIAYLPADRHREGLNLLMTVAENISLATLRPISAGGFVSKGKIATLASEYIDQLKIKTSSVWDQVTKLSGGNQQKVVIAKWLATKPVLLLFDDPNRGVDVGAKFEIHGIVKNVVQTGKACVMTSSELPELLAFCDRIITMYGGRVTGIFRSSELTHQKIMAYVTGAATDF